MTNNQMQSYYRVSVTFNGDKDSNVDFLICSNSEKEAVYKTAKYFLDNSITIDISKVTRTSICGFLGSWDASWLYIVKIMFICNGLEIPKKKTIAVGADKIIDAINIVDHAMEDINTIKHVLLSERQLKSLEYSEPIDYIDYEIEGLLRSEMDLLN